MEFTKLFQFSKNFGSSSSTKKCFYLFIIFFSDPHSPYVFLEVESIPRLWGSFHHRTFKWISQVVWEMIDVSIKLYYWSLALLSVYIN